MTLQLKGHAIGQRIYDETLENFLDFIYSATTLGGDGLHQDDAPIGSVGITPQGFFRKITDNNNTADWVKQASVSDVAKIGLRGTAVVATNDVVAVGVRDLTANPFSDDQAPLISATDFTVGDVIISDQDGTPVLLEVTNVTAPNVTFATYSGDALAPNDTWIVNNFLPEAGGNQEGKTLVGYSSGNAIEVIGNVNWGFATGIDLSTGYTPQNGLITSADSVESAIEKLDGNQQDLQTSSGLAQGATDYGTFTGVTIPDNATNKQALQSLETALENVTGSTNGTGTGVTAVTNVDCVKVDDFEMAEWELVVYDMANTAVKKFGKISALHNGTTVADATKVDYSIDQVLRLDAFNIKIKVVLAGAGALQTFCLSIESTLPAGVGYRFRRTEF